MKRLEFSSYNLQTKIYWGALLILTLIALGFAAYKLLGFSLLNFVFLGGAVIASSLVSQYRLKIQRSQTVFSAKELIFFWGTIWLGIPGAVLLAVTTSLANFSSARKSPRQWLFCAFLNTVSAFAAAVVFYLTLYYSIGFSGENLAGNRIETFWLLAAASLMTFTYFCVFSLISSTFLSI